MPESHEFEIDGTTFRLEPLKLRASLKAEQLVAEAVAPLFAAGASIAQGLPADWAGALKGFGGLEQLVDIFAAQCKVDWDGKVVALPAFLDLVFSRRNAALLAWLLECVEYQFGDFFDGTGLALVSERASRFISLLGSTGGSGESQPTPA